MTRFKYDISQGETFNMYYLQFVYIDPISNFKITITEYHQSIGLTYCVGTFEIIGITKSKYSTPPQSVSVKHIEKMLIAELHNRVSQITNGV